MNKLAHELKAGDRFRGIGRTNFLTCLDNRGEHPLYGQMIDTEERGTLSMPPSYEVEISNAALTRATNSGEDGP